MDLAHSPPPESDRKSEAAEFVNILSYAVWNAAEPVADGGWPLVLRDMCGAESNRAIDGGTLPEAWHALTT